MFSNCNNSSSSDSDEDFYLSKDISKLQPYSFEPLASSSEDENEDETALEQQGAISSCEAATQISRVGNLNWCFCGCCKQMDSEAESLCCQETNEIPDNLFQGMFFLYVSYLLPLIL